MRTLSIAPAGLVVALLLAAVPALAQPVVPPGFEIDLDRKSVV